MVRMLGFSEEEKQRIGVAQTTAGKGMVRGVLGLPGKLVGGILGGSHPSTQASAPNNQVNSFFSSLFKIVNIRVNSCFGSGCFNFYQIGPFINITKRTE